MGIARKVNPVAGKVAKVAGKNLTSLTGSSAFEDIGNKTDKLYKDPEGQAKKALRTMQGKFDEQPVAKRLMQRPTSSWYRG